MRISLADRILHYLDACPPAVSGQRGHAATFSVALALIHGFNLTPQNAMQFMEHYNARCSPPWTTKELRHKLASAARVTPKSGKPRGYLLR